MSVLIPWLLCKMLTLGNLGGGRSEILCTIFALWDYFKNFKNPFNLKFKQALALDQIRSICKAKFDNVLGLGASVGEKKCCYRWATCISQ